MLPAPRYPLCFRSGEQNLHISAAEFELLGPPGGRSSLLPPPRYPLYLRFGEQNLHISAAGFELLGRPAAASLCSPLPAIPCAFVSGSKIFTFPPPDLSLPSARWRRLWLAGSFGGARKSKKRCKEGLIGHPCITFSILFLSKKECPQCGGVFRPPTRTPGFHSCGVLAASRCRSSGPSYIRSGLG